MTASEGVRASGSYCELLGHTMILVTGATGFIGRSLTNALTLAGREWKAYDGRINNIFTLREQLEDVDTVIHLAGAEAHGRNRRLRYVDVAGSENLLKTCQRVQVQRLIVVSRIGADANSLHSLLRAKGQVERLVQKADVPYTILRPATLYGRGDRFFEIIVSLALWSWPIAWIPGGGAMVMQPLWVEDFVRCLAATLDRPDLVGKTITLAGEERLHYREIVRQLLATVGCRRLFVKLPLVTLRPLSALLFGWRRRPPVTRYFVDRFFVPDVAESDSVARHFGFRPSPISDTIAYLSRPGLRWRLFRR